ncbi:MAG: Serine/threonine-protein kinase PknD [Anaerolineales bacterium]|nr:Serine/threonine-protein kinase PknD [Anaerolineales bacterium]
MSFNVGENVGPYRIMEQLGQGGMATVFKAYHASLDRYVALKVLHTAFGEDPSFEARFQREARLVAKLEHPNIVPVYDYAEHTGRKYLVMKYIEGETLKARLQRGPLSAEELNKIISAIGSALAYAHKMGILHRDIKPSNVLLTTDGSIYLADFGLARIAAAGESTLSGDMIMGTPQYISPEQAMGKKELDEGTDIYSFGVMLYEMVVGQVPFSADTPFSIIHDHIYTPLPLPRNINPEVPETVERVLLKSLAKERADRYPDVASLVHAFQEAWREAGVPMKGTTISMSAKEVAARVAPGSASKKEAARATEKTVAAQEIKPRKKPSRWMIASAAGMLLLCCLFFALAANRQKLFRANQTATQTPAPIGATPTPASLATLSSPDAGAPLGILLDDFEGSPPQDTSGWEGYTQDDTSGKIACAVVSDRAFSGGNSLAFEFDVPAQSWATCGIYFDGEKNWSDKQGLAFYLRADQAGRPFDVMMYGGMSGARTTFLHRVESPPGSEADWVRVEIRWEDFVGVEWEPAVAGTPFDAAGVTGFSIGFAETIEQTTGSIWIDDVSLFGKSPRQPGGQATVAPSTSVLSEPTPSAAVLEALALVEANPRDPEANLQLSLAYWDNGQIVPAYQALNTAANLADPMNRSFFLEAARQYAEREGWVASAAMYLRSIRTLPPNAVIPAELEAGMHEAVYKAAVFPDVTDFLPFDSIARVDQPIALIAQGRSALSSGDTVQARDYLNQAKSLNPNMAEISLLESEILVREGSRDAAQQLLQGLSADLGISDWIRALADQYLLQLQ